MPRNQLGVIASLVLAAGASGQTIINTTDVTITGDRVFNGTLDGVAFTTTLQNTTLGDVMLVFVRGDLTLGAGRKINIVGNRPLRILVAGDLVPRRVGADDGDGAGDADVTVLQLRHMLGTGDFKHAVQHVKNQGSIAQDMGEYFPRGRYLSTSSFEAAIPCLIEQR